MEREELEAEVRELRALASELDELKSQVAELESKHEQERQERKALIDYRTVTSATDASLEQVFVAGRPLGAMIGGVADRLDKHEIVHDQLEQRLQEEQQTRGREDAKLRRRLAAVAEQADVDVTDADLMADDKIKRVLAHGPEDVTDQVSSVDRRARDLLLNLPTWGTTMSDKKGRRVTITGPDARKNLETYRDESLQSTQIGRVFKRIESWGAESPRHVAADFSGTPNRLVVSLEESKEN
jgi:hypothetical protein